MESGTSERFGDWLRIEASELMDARTVEGALDRLTEFLGPSDGCGVIELHGGGRVGSSSCTGALTALWRRLSPRRERSHGSL